MIPKGAQKVLISAVISNAEAVGRWLNGEPNVVEGTTLIPTFRSVGFASWLDQLGRIEYVDSRGAEQGEFFVPRVIERFKLGRKKRERTDRFFLKKLTDRPSHYTLASNWSRMAVSLFSAEGNRQRPASAKRPLILSREAHHWPYRQIFQTPRKLSG